MTKAGKRCKHCGKVNYSRTWALQEMLKPSRKACRVYRCPGSKWWHLTSHPAWVDGFRLNETERK